MTNPTDNQGTFWKEIEAKAASLGKDLTMLRVITEDDLSRARNAMHRLKTVTDELRIETQATPNIAAYSTIFSKLAVYSTHLNSINRLASERATILQDIIKDPQLYSLAG